MRVLQALLEPGMAVILLGSIWFAGFAQQGQEQTEHLFLPPADPTFAQRMQAMAREDEHQERASLPVQSALVSP